MKEIKISPSLLSADWLKLGEELDNLYSWGADMVHCDVIDGIFAPNITFGMPMIRALKKRTKLPLDVHLMITKPERYIDEFIKAGSDTLSFHPESSDCPVEILDKIRANNIKAGIALNPDIEVSAAIPYIEHIDYILLMGVFPGFGGQKFIPEVLDKIAQAKQIIGERNIYVELDGGVNISNIGQMKALGLDAAVAGNAVFGAQDPAKAIIELKNA